MKSKPESCQSLFIYLKPNSMILARNNTSLAYSGHTCQFWDPFQLGLNMSFLNPHWEHLKIISNSCDVLKICKLNVTLARTLRLCSSRDPDFYKDNTLFTFFLKVSTTTLDLARGSPWTEVLQPCPCNGSINTEWWSTDLQHHSAELEANSLKGGWVYYRLKWNYQTGVRACVCMLKTSLKHCALH